MGRKTKEYRVDELNMINILNNVFYDWALQHCDTLTKMERRNFTAIMMKIMNHLDGSLDKETIGLLSDDHNGGEE